MKIVRTSYDRSEGRRDRRYPLPQLVVLIDGKEYTTINWSLGGFLIGSFAQRLAIGAPVVGRLRITGEKAPLRFSGSVVRIDEPDPGCLAVQFNELDEGGIEMLDRCIARRMFRGRSGRSG